MGEMTPVLVIDHFRFREASHRTMRGDEAEPWPGSEAEPLEFVSRRGGKSLATQRSPCGDGVRR